MKTVIISITLLLLQFVKIQGFLQQQQKQQQQQNGNRLVGKSSRAIGTVGRTSPTTTSSSSPSLSKSRRSSHSISTSSSRLSAHVDDFKHTLAILRMPSTSTDRIANEAILNTAVQHTRKLSVVLRCDDDDNQPSLAKLRQYVGEVYSTLWDVAMSHDNTQTTTPSNKAGGSENTSSSHSHSNSNSEFCDVVVYPQNLPNAAPESWIHVAPDLDSVCSHDSITGWVSVGKGRGQLYEESQGDGMGGLDAHVAALNAERNYRNLEPVVALHVDPWPKGASVDWQVSNDVVFLDDDDEDVLATASTNVPKTDFEVSDDCINDDGNKSDNDDDNDDKECNLIGGARIPSQCLFDKVAVGGTFDGMHYGHRKLLTLAVSSVNPQTGKLLIGVTIDDMLQHKSYSEEIPSMKERMDGAREFVYRLAPGIKNRVKLRPIADEYGPLGTVEEGRDFDALVLSHETLDNGHKLNEYRKDTLGLKPVALLCTRRTEPHGMSSTALRRRKWERKQRRKAAAAGRR